LTQLDYAARDIELSLEEAAGLARDSFRYFRKLMRPDIDEIADHLQQFYYDLIAGKRPKLALMTGPQHGKSWAVADFAAWAAGQNPGAKWMCEFTRWPRPMAQDNHLIEKIIKIINSISAARRELEWVQCKE
jgi:hypothetical protein